MAIKTMNSEEVRRNLRDVLDEVYTGSDVVIERYNKPIAAMIRYEDFLALQEELEDLRIGKRAQKAYEAWKRDPSRGRPYSEIRAEMVAGDNRAAKELILNWLADESGYDESVWPEVKRIIEENRLSPRKRFRG